MLMNDGLVLIHDFLTFVKSYCFLPLLLSVAAYAATYGMSPSKFCLVRYSEYRDQCRRDKPTGVCNFPGASR